MDGGQGAGGTEHGEKQRKDAFKSRKESAVAGAGQDGDGVEDIVEYEELGDINPVDGTTNELAFIHKDGLSG